MWKLLNLLPGRRRRMEQELERELRYHVDRRVDDLVRSGMRDADARRQVAIEFGGVPQVREEVREAWVWRWLANGQRDLQYAGRLLRRNPVFAATALLSIALGIGASAAVFSLIDQVLLRPLPVSEPDRLVHFNWKGCHALVKLRLQLPEFLSALPRAPGRAARLRRRRLPSSGQRQSFDRAAAATGACGDCVRLLFHCSRRAAAARAADRCFG